MKIAITSGSTNHEYLSLAECSGQEDERPLQRGRWRVVHHGYRARQELHALHVLWRLPRYTRLEVRVVQVFRIRRKGQD